MGLLNLAKLSFVDLGPQKLGERRRPSGEAITLQRREDVEGYALQFPAPDICVHCTRY